jgi:hypothetical protein
MNRVRLIVAIVTISCAFCWYGSAQDQGQSDPKSTLRQKVGETPDWLKQWWSLTDDQRRQGGTIVSKNGGSLTPKWDDDPAIQTWRDKNGFNVRPIVPQDLRSALKMQEQVLGDMASSIRKQEAAINQDIRDNKEEFFSAKDEERSQKSRKSNLELQKYNAEQKWAHSRFDRCPKGYPWDVCYEHEAEKASWDADRDRELKPILDGIANADKRILDALTKEQSAKSKLDQAKQQQSQLQDRVENYNSLKGKQNRGEPFLFMPK